MLLPASMSSKLLSQRSILEHIVLLLTVIIILTKAVKITLLGLGCESLISKWFVGHSRTLPRDWCCPWDKGSQFFCFSISRTLSSKREAYHNRDGPITLLFRMGGYSLSNPRVGNRCEFIALYWDPPEPLLHAIRPPMLGRKMDQKLPQ